MKVSLLLAALVTISCSSSTAPTPEQPSLPKTVIDCSLVGMLPCQQPPPVTPTAPKPTPGQTVAVVSGTVTDGTSGGILPNITITESAGLTVRSDATGHYHFTDVPVGPLTLIVSAESYIRQTVSVNVAADMTVDVVLQRIPAPVPAPPPPTPPAPRPPPPPAPAPTLAIGLNCTSLAAPLNTDVNCNVTAWLGDVVTSQIASVSWEWADGSPTTTIAAPATSHHYVNLGTYVIAVRVAMNTGGSGSAYTTVVIK